MADENQVTQEAPAVAEETQADDQGRIDDVFSDAGAEVTPEPEQGEQQAESTPTEVSTPEPETTPQDTTPVSESTETHGLQAALLAERRKRQEAEAKLKELSAPKQEQAAIPDPIEDPNGYANYISQQTAGANLQNRLAMSRELAVSILPDYEQKEAVFLSMVRDDEGRITDQGLWQRLMAAPNPAKFAYDTANQALMVRERMSPDYEAKIRADERAKIEAELAALKPKALTATQVPKLVQATAAGTNAIQTVREVKSIDDVFS